MLLRIEVIDPGAPAHAAFCVGHGVCRLPVAYPVPQAQLGIDEVRPDAIAPAVEARCLVTLTQRVKASLEPPKERRWQLVLNVMDVRAERGAAL